MRLGIKLNNRNPQIEKLITRSNVALVRFLNKQHDEKVAEVFQDIK